MSLPRSPRPAEPDAHLRLTTGNLVVDLRGCRTAVRNFLRDWLSHPHPSMTARSEEHTSELQSLMRISYAVFCLKKKKSHRNNTKPTQLEQHTPYTTYLPTQ